MLRRATGNGYGDIAATAFEDASSATEPSKTPTAQSSNSGATDGIGGASATGSSKQLENTLGRLADQMEKTGQAPKKSLGDHLATVNDHVARESTATHVSVNTHHSD